METLTEDYLLTIGATRSMCGGVRFGPRALNVATQNGVLYVVDRESAVELGLLSEFSRERFAALVGVLGIVAEPAKPVVVKSSRKRKPK